MISLDGLIFLLMDYDKEEFDRIKKAAAKIQGDSEVLLVIGIGGSYLGARAAIEFLRHSFYNVVDKEIRKTPEIYFVGNSISSTYIRHLMDVIGTRISHQYDQQVRNPPRSPNLRSGCLKNARDEVWQGRGSRRIYATTDNVRGSLRIWQRGATKSFVVR